MQQPFDRIIVTARSNDIDPNWWRLLAPGGRIVVPLDIGYGGERAIGFVREGDAAAQRRILRVCVRGAARRNVSRTIRRCSSASRAMRYATRAGRNVHRSTWLRSSESQRRYLVARRRDAVVARPHTLFAVTRTS